MIKIHMCIKKYFTTIYYQYLEEDHYIDQRSIITDNKSVYHK